MTYFEIYERTMWTLTVLFWPAFIVAYLVMDTELKIKGWNLWCLNIVYKALFVMWPLFFILKIWGF